MSENFKQEILFLIRDLGYGGAQRQMVVLAKALREQGHSVSVMVLYSGNPFEQELMSAGVALHELKKRGRWDILFPAVRMVRLLRGNKPRVLYSWMPAANLIAVAIRCFLRKGTKIVWGIRASTLDFSNYGWLTRLMWRLEARFSRLPDLIIANSYTGRDHAIARGFANKSFEVVPNGIDTDFFRPLPGEAGNLRRELGIADSECVAGMVGRIDPMKGHETFLQAAADVYENNNNCRFLIVGDGPQARVHALKKQAERLGIYNRILWTGNRTDTPVIYSALDVFVSASSYGEGFPNVIGEAMACGTSCVATDVGDSARIVGDTGIVVEKDDPRKLARGILDLLEWKSRNPGLSGQARERIVQNFSVSRLCRNTLDAIQKLP